MTADEIFEEDEHYSGPCTSCDGVGWDAYMEAACLYCDGVGWID